jgi:hypothetical protein
VEKRKTLQDYDKQLKKFQYKNALNAAFNKKNSAATVSLIEELIQRGTLEIALQGRDDVYFRIHFNFV